jgi:hypothetical protein
MGRNSGRLAPHKTLEHKGMSGQSPLKAKPLRLPGESVGQPAKMTAVTANAVCFTTYGLLDLTLITL